MKFGLTKWQCAYLQDVVLAPLKNKGARIWIFGSRARGDHEKFSDVDLMVESEQDISSTLSEIQETLENGNFPYKVDMVQSRNFAESYRQSFEIDKLEL